MYPLELKKSPDIKHIITAAFAGYRKERAYVSVFHPLNLNSYWDGRSDPSRPEYALVNLATGQRISLPSSSDPYFDIARHSLADRDEPAISTDHVGNVTLKMLPDNYALVAAGTFCGKPATAHVYVNHSNLASTVDYTLRTGQVILAVNVCR